MAGHRRSDEGARRPAAGLLRPYAPLPGVPDELMDASGALRPVWEHFIDHVSRMPAGELASRFERGDQYLRDAGVYFRQYGDVEAAERDWPLSHVPVLVAEEEWRSLEQGLIQRADLLERVVADIYGQNRLVAEGHLPAPLVAMNPEWLRPLVGVVPRGGHFLHFVAFEVGRGPDGSWWVLGDRTQAPSGAGFALENRVATTRVFPDLFAQMNVHRLAGFFRGFRDTLLGLRGEGDSRVGILTPGPLNDTYFEHAYIARYLGFMLLEGEDLTVQDNQVMVRTVAGLRPISVLWRRLDAAWADPLELGEGSRLGTPGIVGAVRHGNVSMINALGAGILETRALLAFLPRISEVLRDEPLAIPNIATWWCGQRAERDYVKDNAGRMMFGSALSTQPLFAAGESLDPPGGRTATADLAAWIEAEGPRLVAQESLTLSTTPVHAGGRLAPGPMSLRVFLARTKDGWQVMPGGYARIGQPGGDAAIAMHEGGSVADVWVVSDGPVPADTMLPQAAQFARNQPAILPSRAADNLFWLGRYVERAEGTIRLLRAYHARLAESATPDGPLLAGLYTYLENVGIEAGEGIPDGLFAALEAALRSAGHVRDRFSVDGWAALVDLVKSARRLSRTVAPGDDEARAMGVLLRKVTGFSGLVHDNMYRFTGWRFLGIGRSLERSLAMSALLAAFADPDSPEGGLDLALEIGDSVMSHRRRYAVTTSRETVVDLLALDAMNPRAIAYHLSEIHEHVSLLPGAQVHGQLSPLSRAILTVQTSLLVSTPETLDTAALVALGGDLAGLSDELSAAYLK